MNKEKKYLFEKSDMISMIDSFIELYSNRPIFDNSGGMKSAQLFPLFYYLKKFNPKLIIESGVYRGQGTWLIRKCCPDSKIISIDIDLSQLTFRDNNKNTIYFDRDITQIDLNEIIKSYNSDEILIFFDDHQDFNKRIEFLIKNNLKHVIYEDNYPYDQGDCISPKKIIESNNFIVSKVETSISDDETNFIINSINHYEEFPPIFLDKKTRWGNDWLYNTRESLLDINYADGYNLLYSERFDYTWICYLEIK